MKWTSDAKILAIMALILSIICLVLLGFVLTAMEVFHALSTGWGM